MLVPGCSSAGVLVPGRSGSLGPTTSSVRGGLFVALFGTGLLAAGGAAAGDSTGGRLLVDAPPGLSGPGAELPHGALSGPELPRGELSRGELPGAE